MAGKQVVILHTPNHQQTAMAMLRSMPKGSVVTFEPPRRTLPQNDKMWAMLTDISMSKPRGEAHDTEVWKEYLMEESLVCKPVEVVLAARR